MTSIYGIMSQYFTYSSLLVLLAFAYSNIWVRFNQKLKYAYELNSQGKFLQQYHLLNDLQNETLWESEKVRLDLNRAKLFFDVGNHKRFLLLMDGIANKIEKYPKEKYFYGLLKSFYFEIKNDWKSAVIELEHVYENTNLNDIKLQAYNNLGRIEMVQGNNMSSQSFYEKSFEILKKSPNPKYFSLVIHNLLIAYAKNNDTQKSENLLNEYWELVDKNSVQQILEYANDMTHYARQINNKIIIEKSHKIVEKFVMNIMNEKEKFVLEITELRMKYNDNVNFVQHFEKIFEKIKQKKDEFSLKEKLIILNELRHVLLQKMQNEPKEARWINNFSWCTTWHISVEKEISEELKSVESSLSSIRIYWLGELVRLEKSKIVFLSKKEDYIPAITSIMNYIDEMIRLWRDADNKINEINELIHAMDECNNYFIQTQDMRLIQIFQEKMKEYLVKADKLLEKNWQNPGIEEYMISLAWFSWHIGNDKIQASKWIDRFNRQNHSLKHYAKYVSIWYKETEQWINTLK